MSQLIAAARPKHRTSPNGSTPLPTDGAARLTRMVHDARAKLELLAPGAGRKEILAWFHKHGEHDGVGILLRVARVPLNDEGCVSHAACGAFEAEASTVVEGLITSSINSSVISALLLSIEIPLLVAAIERPEAPSALEDQGWASDYAFDSLAVYFAPSDPLPLSRGLLIAQGVCLSISASLAVVSLFMGILNCQPLASFPGPILTVDYFMQETKVLKAAQFPWLGSLFFLLLALPFAVAWHSAAGFFYTLLLPLTFFGVLSQIARNDGPGIKQCFMLHAEAMAVLARIKDEVRTASR